MSIKSLILKLFETDMKTDGNDYFDFDRDLNENWDKIDSAIGNIYKNYSDINLSNLSDEGIAYLRQVTNELLTPVDLKVKFKDEIDSNFDGNEWAWIQNRVQTQNWTGLNIGDGLWVTLTGGTIGGTFTIPEEKIFMQIAGIDTYYNSGDTAIPHHIDFAARETLGTCSVWNAGNTNNGTAAEPNPYKSSRIYTILNGGNNYTTSAQGSLAHGLNCSSGGVLQMLPQECQDVLIQKRTWSEEQYSSSAQTVQPTGHGWRDMGKLFPFHEVEVCGYQPNSYNRGEAGNIDNLTRNLTKQYPIFKYQTRVKLSAIDGSRSNYWLCCPSGTSASAVCHVHGGGAVDQNDAANTYISLCFGFRVA